MSLTIIRSKDTPTSNYFATADAEPGLDGTTLTIFDGSKRRYWGSPQVNSTVVLKDDDLTSVHVGFSHKHGGGQFWRHYRNGEQVTWAKLTDEERRRVLTAAETKAPGYAKAPGKLRGERGIPSDTVAGYKVVRVNADGTMASLYSPDIPYVIGETLRGVARDGHGGGFYFYRGHNVYQEPDFDADRIVVRELRDAVARRGIVAKNRWEDVERIAIVAVAVAGNLVRYPAGDSDIQKCAASSIKPLRVIETMEVHA